MYIDTVLIDKFSNIFTETYEISTSCNGWQLECIVLFHQWTHSSI